MLKKIMTTLILGILLTVPLACNASVDHSKCIEKLKIDTSDKRWEHVNCDPDFLCYDKTTIEKENKYNPFGDKIITLWVAYCLHREHFTTSRIEDTGKFSVSKDGSIKLPITEWIKYEDSRPRLQRITFNLDKRSCRLEGTDKFISITPGSGDERILELIKDVY